MVLMAKKKSDTAISQLPTMPKEEQKALCMSCMPTMPEPSVSTPDTNSTKPVNVHTNRSTLMPTMAIMPCS